MKRDTITKSSERSTNTQCGDSSIRRLFISFRLIGLWNAIESSAYWEAHAKAWLQFLRLDIQIMKRIMGCRFREYCHV